MLGVDEGVEPRLVALALFRPLQRRAAARRLQHRLEALPLGAQRLEPRLVKAARAHEVQELQPVVARSSQHVLFNVPVHLHADPQLRQGQLLHLAQALKVLISPRHKGVDLCGELLELGVVLALVCVMGIFAQAPAEPRHVRGHPQGQHSVGVDQWENMERCAALSRARDAPLPR